MQRSLQEHILFLETTLQDLRERLTHETIPHEKRETLLAHIQFANDALSHYRKAYELEFVVASGEALKAPQPDSNKKL